jgi:hypothetical protein
LALTSRFACRLRISAFSVRTEKTCVELSVAATAGLLESASMDGTKSKAATITKTVTIVTKFFFFIFPLLIIIVIHLMSQTGYLILFPNPATLKQG